MRLIIRIVVFIFALPVTNPAFAGGAILDGVGLDDMCSVIKLFTHYSHGKEDAKSLAKKIILDVDLKDQFDNQAFHQNASKPNELEAYLNTCISTAKLPSELVLTITGGSSYGGVYGAKYDFRSNEIVFDFRNKITTALERSRLPGPGLLGSPTMWGSAWANTISRDVALMNGKRFFFPFSMGIEIPDTNFRVKEPDLDSAKKIVRLFDQNKNITGTLKIKMDISGVTYIEPKSRRPGSVVQLTPRTIEVFDSTDTPMLSSAGR